MKKIVRKLGKESTSHVSISLQLRSRGGCVGEGISRVRGDRFFGGLANSTMTLYWDKLGFDDTKVG